MAAAAKESLLLAAARAKKGKPEETEAEKLRKEEQAIMADITRKTALKGVKELARVSGGAQAAHCMCAATAGGPQPAAP